MGIFVSVCVVLFLVAFARLMLSGYASPAKLKHDALKADEEE